MKVLRPRNRIVWYRWNDNVQGWVRECVRCEWGGGGGGGGGGRQVLYYFPKGWDW